MSQARLAEAAGITERMVRAYETENVNPPARVLAALARTLGVRIDDLFEHAENEPTQQRKVRTGSPPVAPTTPTAPEGFGDHLAQLRQLKGLTQEALGSAVGISKRMVTYYEAQGGNPPASLLPRLADALGVSIDDLFGRNQEPTNEPTSNLRLLRKFSAVEKLTPRDRQAILRQINALIQSRDESA